MDVAAATGALLGTLGLGEEQPTGLALGGDHNLYVTTESRLLRVPLKSAVAAAPPPKGSQ